MENKVCPYLDLAGMPADATAGGRRCEALRPAAAVDEVHQRVFCLTAEHVRCTLYTAAQVGEQAAREAAAAPAAGSARTLARLWPWALFAVIAVVVAVLYRRDLFGSGAAAPAPVAPVAVAATTAATPVAVEPTQSPIPAAGAPDAADATVAVDASGATGAAVPAGQAGGAAEPATPTAVPGGSVLALEPEAGGSGWWASGEGLAEHLDDSFLYAGYHNGRATLSAVQFDLRRLRRGAPILEARLVLTGLNEERLNRRAGGTWSVQLLAPEGPDGKGLPELARADFQTLYNAPAAVTLFPTLFPADLEAGGRAVFVLDGEARAWLEKRALDGVTTVVVRILGPAGGEDTLFAWDSGTGPATRGHAPQLVLNLGAPPATPPPLATQQFIVATLTATPANVLTVAAHIELATQVAETVGTYTPVPYLIATPTPLPDNLDAIQAARALEGLPPLVVYTPVPANAATATANAVLATAVARTTGTFTPVPTNAVTPIVVLPTPQPENAATEVSQVRAAEERARRAGTDTPLPPGVLVATRTPAPPVIASTATPANAATAVMNAAEATLSALTVGTYTPVPSNARTPTPPPPTPTPTPVPLLVRDTPRPTSTATPSIPGSMPDALRGLVLFHSDRNGKVELFAVDPAAGVVYRVTQEWPFSLAQQFEGRAPDGFARVVVQDDNRSVPQLYIVDSRYEGQRQLTATTGWSYDAAWSPRGDLIVFVSQEPGNDELYTIRPDGSDMRRLTANDWEWDKHPSWSPDGGQIVFWSNRETGRRQLWIMNADGSNQRRLHDSPYNDWDPIWVK